MALFYEDMRIGREFISKSKLLSRKDIDRFASLTGDFNPVHVDEGYARATIFGGRIAHGLLALSLAIGLWYEMNLTRDSLVALLAFKEVVFRSPVRPGRRLHLVSKVTSRRSSGSRPDAGIVAIRDLVVSDEGETFLEFERVLLLKKKGRR